MAFVVIIFLALTAKMLTAAKNLLEHKIHNVPHIQMRKIVTTACGIHLLIYSIYLYDGTKI